MYLSSPAKSIVILATPLLKPLTTYLPPSYVRVATSGLSLMNDNLLISPSFKGPLIQYSLPTLTDNSEGFATNSGVFLPTSNVIVLVADKYSSFPSRLIVIFAIPSPITR